MQSTALRRLAGLALYAASLAASLTGCTKLDDLVQPSCTYAVAPATWSFGSPGGAADLNVSANGVCGWSTETPAWWITITAGKSGNGNGTVSYSVLANDQPTGRTATFVVAGRTVTITQAALGTTTTTCSYAAAPTNANHN